MSLFDELREVAAHVDPQFHPTLNELPALFAAFVAQSKLGNEFEQAIEAGQKRQAELHPAEVQGNEVRTTVAHLIEPPGDPDTSSGGGGVSKARYDALASEVEQLRASLDALAGHIPLPQQPAPSSPPVAAAVPPEPAAGAPGVDTPAPAQEPFPGAAGPVGDPPAAQDVTPPADTGNAGSSAAGPANAREMELQAEVEQLQAQLAQRAALDTATGQHPTASSEPTP